MDIFITGTDTDVGKTTVTAGIAAVMQGLGYKIGVYKPVQSGSIKYGDKFLSPDTQFVNFIDPNIMTKTSYNLINPVAPSLAASLEGIRINHEQISRDYLGLKKHCDFVLVEGAGGFLSPIYQNYLVRDIPKRLNLPILIVARPNLGTINHTLLTIEAAKSHKIEILGVIISKYPSQTDDISIKMAPQIIEELSGVKILGILPQIQNANGEEIASECLIDAVINNFNLQEIFKIKIPKLS